jgi:gluconolactonase
MAATPQIATTVAFTEGPTCDKAGNVYFTETKFNRIMKLTPKGELSVYRENSNAANGLVFDLEERLVACEGNNQNPRVTRTNLESGRVEVLADRSKGLTLTAPNDVTFDSKGRLYFTDLPGGTVHRIDTDGRFHESSPRPISSGLTASRFQRTTRPCTWWKPIRRPAVRGSCAPTISSRMAP